MATLVAKDKYVNYGGAGGGGTIKFTLGEDVAEGDFLFTNNAGTVDKGSDAVLNETFVMDSLKESNAITGNPESFKHLEFYGDYVIVHCVYRHSGGYGSLVVIGVLKDNLTIEWGVPYTSSLYETNTSNTYKFKFVESTQMLYILERSGSAYQYKTYLRAASLKLDELKVNTIGSYNLGSCYDSHMDLDPVNNRIVIFKDRYSSNGIDIYTFPTNAMPSGGNSVGTSYLTTSQFTYCHFVKYIAAESKFFFAYSESSMHWGTFTVNSQGQAVASVSPRQLHGSASRTQTPFIFNEAGDYGMWIAGSSHIAFKYVNGAVTVGTPNNITEPHLRKKPALGASDDESIYLSITDGKNLSIAELSVDDSLDITFNKIGSIPNGGLQYAFMAYNHKFDCWMAYHFDGVTKSITTVPFLSKTPANMKNTLVGLAPEIGSTGDEVDIPYITKEPTIVRTSLSLTPTKTYRFSIDGSIKEQGALSAIDLHLGISGYAISANELVLNKE